MCVSLEVVTGMKAAALKFDEKGLIPAIVQDYAGGEVLMLAYMNKESLEKTLETGMTCFYSRSRQELWQKGLTSGNTQEVMSLYYDCDADTLLVRVKAAGPACHKGTNTCFTGLLACRGEGGKREGEGEGENLADFPFVLEEIILKRRILKQKGSYVASLYEKGIDSMLKKIGEEGAEVVIAAKNNDPGELIYEAGDLLFHLILVLGARGVSYRQVLAELASRHQQKAALEEQ